MLSRAKFIKLLGTGVGMAALGSRLLGQEKTPSLTNPERVAPASPSAPPPGPAHCVYHGSGFGNRLAITFDDGPTPGITEHILEELAKRNLKATFFMIGNKVRRYPSLAREVLAAGHEIGNHSYTHPMLSHLPDAQVIQELTQCQDAIEKATGVTPQWFRPPYAAFNKNRQGPMARSMHLGVTYWSVDPRDWSRPGVENIISRVLNGARPGSIILLHDLKTQTLKATPTILDSLMEREYKLTTISGYLGDPYGSYVTAS